VAAQGGFTAGYYIHCLACSQLPRLGGKLLACARCGSAKYCSKACQEAHWPTHKSRCKEQRQARGRGLHSSTSQLNQSGFGQCAVFCPVLAEL
jgi:hypothetical protein